MIAGGFLSGIGMAGGKLALQKGGNAVYDHFTRRQKSQTAENVTGAGVDSRFGADAGVDTTAAENGVEGAEMPSTAIDTNPTTHTAEQQAVINEYQGAADKGILAFIDRWRGLKDPNYRKKVRMDIAPVDQRAVADIKATTGIDVSDFTGHSLSGNALEHIDLRHGVQGEADQSMADLNDIARMGYVLEHYDGVEQLLDKQGNPVLSGEYYNADGSRAPMVRFQKRVDGTYYVVEAVPDAAMREFRVISAYMQKGSDSTGQELTYHKSDPQLTSKTHLDAHTIASMDSIPQTAQDVNPETGDGMPNSVGVAARGFTTPDAPNETRVSRQAETTLSYNDQRGAAAPMTQGEWNESFRYEVQSREQWEQWAGERLFVERGERPGQGKRCLWCPTWRYRRLCRGFP